MFLGARDLNVASAAASRVGPSVIPLALDVTSDASVAAAAETIGRTASRLDALINNAGVLYDPTATAETVTPEIVRATMETNLLGPLRVTHACLPWLRRSASPRVINVSSEAGQLAGGLASWAPAYSMSKTALNMLTQQLAAALPGIAVNSVCPGWCRTAMGGDAAPRTPEQGAETAVWLALDAPASLTGQFLRDREALAW